MLADAMPPPTTMSTRSVLGALSAGCDIAYTSCRSLGRQSQRRWSSQSCPPTAGSGLHCAGNRHSLQVAHRGGNLSHAACLCASTHSRQLPGLPLLPFPDGRQRRPLHGCRSTPDGLQIQPHSSFCSCPHSCQCVCLLQPGAGLADGGLGGTASRQSVPLGPCQEGPAGWQHSTK